MPLVGGLEGAVGPGVVEPFVAPTGGTEVVEVGGLAPPVSV